MTFFEGELRKILNDVRCPVRYIGNAAYVSVGDVRIKVSLSESGHADHYDTLLMVAFNRSDGEIDRLGSKFCDIIGVKVSSNPNFKASGIRPHVWRDITGKYEWYGYVPALRDYELMRDYVMAYINVFR